MTTTPSPRYGSGLNTYSTDADFWIGRPGWNAMVAALEAQGAIVTQGVTSARPAANAATPRRFFFATDTGILSYDNGGTWITIGSLGGATPTSSYPGTTASEGMSTAGARADHSHFNPPVTFQTAPVGGQINATGTFDLTSAINVAAVPYPRVLEARLRGMATAQSARVQWAITNVATSTTLKAGSATAPNNSVEVTHRELLPANTARSVRGTLITDAGANANTPASGAYSEFTVVTYPAGTP